MRIPKIFWSSKSDNFKSFKSYFESFKWLEKVFYSSSFFCEFLFLISSHTEIPLTFTRECQLSISPPHPRAIATPQKWGPHRRTPKNIGLNFPLVMGCTRLMKPYSRLFKQLSLYKKPNAGDWARIEKGRNRKSRNQVSIMSNEIKNVNSVKSNDDYVWAIFKHLNSSNE